MTDNRNLSDLIKENKRLIAEVERLEAELAEERAKHQITGNPLADAIRAKWEAPAESPKPKFAIGDKVRIIGKQESPPPITDYGRGEYDTIATIEKEGGYKLRYSGEKLSFLVWFDEELAPYNDTE